MQENLEKDYASFSLPPSMWKRSKYQIFSIAFENNFSGECQSIRFPKKRMEPLRSVMLGGGGKRRNGSLLQKSLPDFN